MDGGNKKASKGERYMEEDSSGREESDSSKENKWQEEEKEESYLTAKMNMATTQLHLGSDDEGSNFQENDISIYSDNLDLSQESSMQHTSRSMPTPKPSCMLCGMQQGLQRELWLLVWTSSRTS